MTPGLIQIFSRTQRHDVSRYAESKQRAGPLETANFSESAWEQSPTYWMADYGQKGANIAEPITFEVLRYATDAEVKQLTSQFQTLPALATPADVWDRGAALGRECRRKNI